MFSVQFEAFAAHLFKLFDANIFIEMNERDEENGNR